MVIFVWFYSFFVGHQITVLEVITSMVSFSSSFNFRNDNRHLVFVEIFSFIPTAPSLMGHVRVSRDKESVIQVMQDGDFYRFFFSNYHRRQFLFWPSYLSSAKCLHTRHKDSFFFRNFSLEIFESRIAKCAFISCWCCFIQLFWDLQLCNQRGQENFHSHLCMIRDVD